MFCLPAAPAFLPLLLPHYPHTHCLRSTYCVRSTFSTYTVYAHTPCTPVYATAPLYHHLPAPCRSAACLLPAVFLGLCTAHRHYTFTISCMHHTHYLYYHLSFHLPVVFLGSIFTTAFYSCIFYFSFFLTFYLGFCFFTTTCILCMSHVRFTGFVHWFHTVLRWVSITVQCHFAVFCRSPFSPPFATPAPACNLCTPRLLVTTTSLDLCRSLFWTLLLPYHHFPDSIHVSPHLFFRLFTTLLPYTTAVHLPSHHLSFYTVGFSSPPHTLASYHTCTHLLCLSSTACITVHLDWFCCHDLPLHCCCLYTRITYHWNCCMPPHAPCTPAFLPAITVLQLSFTGSFCYLHTSVGHRSLFLRLASAILFLSLHHLSFISFCPLRTFCAYLDFVRFVRFVPGRFPAVLPPWCWFFCGSCHPALHTAVPRF